MTETTTKRALMGVTSADMVEPTGAWTPADALGVTKRMSTNATGEQESCECPTCGRDDFDSRTAMKIHHVQAHGESLAGVERTCEHCGDTFRVKPSYVDRGDGRFCSKSCKGESLSEGGTVTRVCKWCEDGFEVRSAIVNDGRGKFCSADCYGRWLSENVNGEDHPLWEGGPETYYGPNWNRQRQKALSRDGRQCVVCARDDVHVHHIRPFRTFGVENYKRANSLDNLVCLCPEHHGKWEGIPLRPEVV